MYSHTATLKQLRACFSRVGIGEHGQACVISGSPGVGKTHLAERFLSEVQSSAICLRARGLPTGVLSLQPIFEALEPYLRSSFGDLIRAVIAEISSYLPAPYQPWLKAARAVRRVHNQIQQGRFSLRNLESIELRAFKAITNLLEELARKRPVVFLIDDVHCVDASTLAFLGQLARRLARLPVLLVFTWRTNGKIDEKADRLRRVFDKDAPDCLREFCIEGLDRTDLRGCIESILGGPIDFTEDVLDSLAHASRGKPYYLQERVRFERRRGRIFESGGVWRFSGAPERVEPSPEAASYLRERLDKLPLEFVSLLQTAACAGVRIDIPLLANVQAISEATVAEILHRVTAEVRIVQLDVTTGCYEFEHSLTRDLIKDELGNAARALHAKLAQAMIDRDDAPELVAEQLAAAGQTERAAAIFLEATCAAFSNSMFELASEFGRRTEKLLDELGAPPGTDEHAEIVYTVAAAMFGAEQYLQVVDYVRRRLQYFTGPAAGRLLHVLGRAEARVPNATAYTQGLAHLHAALALLEGAGQETIQVEIWTDLVNLYDAAGDFDGSWRAYNHALELAQRVNDRAGLVRLARLSCIFLSPAEVVAQIEPAIADATALGMWFERAMCENNLGTACLNLHDFNRAYAHYERAAAILAEHRGHRRDTPLNNLAVLAYHRGDLDGARALLDEALQQSKDSHSKLFIESSLAVLDARAGRLEASRARLERIAETARAAGDLFYRDCIGHNLANVLLELRRPEEALQCITDTPLHTSHGEDELVRGKRAELVLRIFAALDQPAPREHVEAYEQLAASALSQAWLYRSSPWYVSDIEFWED